MEYYLNSKNLIFEFQSGFRHGFSTDTCLIYLNDYIRKQLDLGLLTGMALLDVQKAFDGVNHDILCTKMDSIGINSDWFRSYLSNRHQLVSVNGTFSNECKVTCGVPQGSLLGPLLFLIYCNDLELAVNCKLMLYADDSVLIVSDKDPNIISERLGNEMQNCLEWMVDNKLSMHPGKTELILFGTKQKLNKIDDFHVQFQGHTIKSQKSVKYLGAHIDNDLGGELMVENIVKKVSSRIRFLYRHKSILDMKSRKLLGNALVQCHLDYSISSWFNGLNKNLKHKLQVAQNRLTRFILDMHSREHICQENLDLIGFLNMHDRAKQLMLNHMFNIKNTTAPQYLTQFFTLVANVHRYNTRQSRNSFAISHALSGPTKSSFYHNATLCWNSLPLNITNIQSKVVFKQKVKRYLAEQTKLNESNMYVYN